MILRRPGPAAEHPLEAAELPDPRPAAGELLLRVGACAVCRTDLQIAEGDLVARRLPIVPGHQVVGRVEEVGAGVEGWRAGRPGRGDLAGRLRRHLPPLPGRPREPVRGGAASPAGTATAATPSS